MNALLGIGLTLAAAAGLTGLLARGPTPLAMGLLLWAISTLGAWAAFVAQGGLS